MPVPTLHQLAIKHCIRHIKDIVDVGDVPYAQVRCILLKVESPDQLRQIELASPQICGEDAEIWKAFIKRDIPQWWTVPHEPKNLKNWYKVYRKLKQDAQNKLDKDAAALKAAFAGLQAEKDSLTSKLVNINEIPNISKHTRIGPKPKTQSPPRGSLRGKLTTGKSVLDRARREAQEIHKIRAQSKPAPRVLNDKATQVRTAPRGLVDDPKSSLPGSGNAANTNNDLKKTMPVKKTSSSIITSGTKVTNTITTEKEPKPTPKPVSTVVGTKRDNTGTPISKTFEELFGETFAAVDRMQAFEAAGVPPPRPYKIPRVKTSQSPERPASGNVIIRKREPVDIFMRRPNKKR